MNRLNCLIVDDEPVARKIIREFAEQIPFLMIAGEYGSIQAMEAVLEKESVDLIFLDIEMPKRTGLDFLRSSPGRPMIIITTAYPNHALEGYELDIIDYLVKPIPLSRFLKGCYKAREVADQRSKGQVDDQFIFIRSDKRIERVALNDLLYAEVIGNYITLYTTHRKIIAYLTMKGLETQLPAGRFFRIHQSYLVAISSIESIEGNLVRVAGQDLPISRNYRTDVMKCIEQHMLRR